jgi:glycosyltransferase involved in cell wall biosynthesis
VPNGVNVAGYEAQLNRGAPLPPELARVPQPRLGYVGQISSKLDFELLTAVARARPDWSLVFVGSLTGSAAQADWQALRALPNVFDLGQVPAARVPEYVCGFDVGLMPYRRNEHSQNIDPLKLYDYLAAGLPIASVDLPALDDFRCQVRVGNAPAEFCAALEAALLERSPAQAAERRRVAAQNSWEQRVETISTLIEPWLPGQHHRAARLARRETEPASESLV